MFLRRFSFDISDLESDRVFRKGVKVKYFNYHPPPQTIQNIIIVKFKVIVMGHKMVPKA